MTNKNKQFKMKIESPKKKRTFLNRKLNFSERNIQEEEDPFYVLDTEPINAYNPEQYDIKINSQQQAMKYIKPYKTDKPSIRFQKILSKQIPHVELFSSESIHGESDQMMEVNNRSEPEEEKFPPIILYYENQSKNVNQTDFQQKTKTEAKKQISFAINSNFSETPISKKKQEKYTIFQSENSYLSQDHHLEARLLYWSANTGQSEFVIYFLERKCSPFMINYQGANCIHAAAATGNCDILKIFLEADYEYFELVELLGKNKLNKKRIAKHTFNKQECIDLMTTQLPSTALHLAIEKDHYDCAKLLLRNKASTQLINYRTLRPFELKINVDIKEMQSTFAKQNLITVPSQISNANNEERLQTDFIQKGFYYVIQTTGKKNVYQDIVYIQLQNIFETFKSKGHQFEFVVLYGPNLDKMNTYANNESKPEFFFFVIKLSHELIYYMAEKHELLCYNFSKKFLCEFKYEEKEQFEFPKDIQIQTLIINILNSEFDLENFILEGLILSHFPLEDPRKTDRIQSIWDELILSTIRDTVRIDTDQIALRPLHAQSNYYGPVIGWYFAFVVQTIGWLFAPSVLGVAIGIYMIVSGDYQSRIVPTYALFMALWATLFIEKWKNRTWELKFSWDMHNFRANEPQRVMYTGQFTLDSLKSHVCINDSFTTFKRRIFTDLPIILFGILMIIALFFVFLQWSQINKKNQIASTLIGCLNGACITILSSVYKLICSKLVQWENHKFESEQEFSYIIKVYLFEFLNSYITVVYYAVFEQDPLRLATSVGSIVITRGVIQNVGSDGVPFLIYQIKLRLFRKKFQNFLSVFRERKMKIYQIGNQQYLREKLDERHMIELLQQVEEIIIKEPQKLLFDEYTSIAIQFGYITMFAPSFPAAPVFFMISLYINLRLSLYGYRSCMKREVKMFTFNQKSDVCPPILLASGKTYLKL